MSASRRQFLTLATGAVAGLAAPRGRPKAILFDAFPIFDTGGVRARIESRFPGRGAEIEAAWRARHFQYAWLRATARRYEDFLRVGEDALAATARALSLELAPAERAWIARSYAELDAHPEAPAALAALRSSGVRLGILSNLTREMLDGSIRHAKLDGLFERVLSTDAARTYKPDPRAYRLGLSALRLAADDVLFAAFAGWDAAGATWFGLPTYWVNRAKQTPDELAPPLATGATLDDLLVYVR